MSNDTGAGDCSMGTICFPTAFIINNVSIHDFMWHLYDGTTCTFSVTTRKRPLGVDVLSPGVIKHV